MPIPPASAIKRAMRASVTVSIFAETRGIVSVILRENCARTVSSLREKTADLRGTNSTSSNVNVSRISFIKNTPFGARISSRKYTALKKQNKKNTVDNLAQLGG